MRLMSPAQAPSGVAADSLRRHAGFAQRMPLLTLAVTAMAIIFTFAMPDCWQWSAAAIARGEIWRLLTGHLTHWTRDHFAWDLLMFTTLGLFLERRGRRGVIAAMIATIVLSNGWLQWGQETVSTYRGLSGIDSALFSLLAMRIALDAQLLRPARVIGCVALLVFILKTLYELSGGGTMFVRGHAFIPMPQIHLIGGLCGLLTATMEAGKGCRETD